MVDLKTAIEELNTGKITFEYNSDNCCTTEGEVVIYLKELQRILNIPKKDKPSELHNLKFTERYVDGNE